MSLSSLWAGIPGFRTGKPHHSPKTGGGRAGAWGSKEAGSCASGGPELGFRGEGVRVHATVCARLSPPPRSCILGLKWVKQHTGNLSPGGCELSPRVSPCALPSLLMFCRSGVSKGKPLLHSFSKVGAGGDIVPNSQRVLAPTLLRYVLVCESPDLRHPGAVGDDTGS